ncbi:MAG TPA: T9SS type A sorting domain-containing protein [Terriglobales bacterium]|nr:T9SS type A sorting domain-containing protein [Terriglobales bacterium]
MRLVRLGSSGATRIDFLDLVSSPSLDVPVAGSPRSTLEPPRPNPAARAVEIAYSLDAPAPATLTVHDANGRLVETLSSELAAAGSHHARWNLSDGRHGRVPPGVYFLRLSVGGRELVRRVAVVR